MVYLVIVLTIGVCTYLARVSFIALFADSGVPGWLESPLRYVAPAVMAAIVAPAVFTPTGAFDLSTGNPRFYAAMVAVLVAWRTRSVAWTTAIGMLALWVVTAVT